MTPELIEQFRLASLTMQKPLRSKLVLFALPFLTALIALASFSYVSFESFKPDAPASRELSMIKSLEAELRLSSLDLTGSYLLVLGMANESDPKAIEKLVEQSRQARSAYESRQAYWMANLPDSDVKKHLTGKLKEHAETFFVGVEKAFLPALLSGELSEARRLAYQALKEDFQEHRAAVGELAEMASPLRKTLAARAAYTVATRQLMLLLGSTACIVAGLLIGWVVSARISRSLTHHMASMASWIAEEARDAGPFVARSDGTREMTALSSSFEHVLAQLRRLTRTVSQIANQLAMAWAELNVTVGPMASDTADSLAQAIEANSTNEAVPPTAAGPASPAPLPKEPQSQAEAAEPAAILADLRRSSGHITEIVGIIQGLAVQTNYLVEMAAKETSRADDQSRTLAMLTEQVHSLAERTASATEGIRKMITQLQEDTRGSFSGIQEGSDKVAGGLELVRKTAEAMAAVEERVRRVADTIREIVEQETLETPDSRDSLQPASTTPTVTGSKPGIAPPTR